jgi:hypothetical protein
MAKKYKIENGINFFEELYKSLDIADEYTDDANTKVHCLISNEILTTNHVELKCGHKFNYIPLYNDILNHKKKLNHMEGSSSLLKGNQIRCPYCRKKQDDVLPYYEEYGFPKVGGVNWHVPTYDYSHSHAHHKCEYTDNNDESKLCHFSYTTKLETDDKFYCYVHKKAMIKKLKADALQKAKEEKEKAKEEQKKLKEEEKKAKEKEKVELKLKLKEEKMKLKGESKSKQSKASALVLVEGDEENVIVCGGCTSVIKTGLKKGKPCGTMVFENGLCMRHHNLKTKKAEI